MQKYIVFKNISNHQGKEIKVIEIKLQIGGFRTSKLYPDDAATFWNRVEFNK